MRFEWDESKRETNLAKHGLDLSRADMLFDGRPVFTYASQRGGEPRFVTTGWIDDMFVTAIWTERGEAVRLISLRRARDGEKRTYRARHG